MNTDSNTSILEEVAIMKSLNDNPYVVRLVDSFKDESFYYIVMERFADDLVHAMLDKKDSKFNIPG